jgi:hypothetical protein
VAAFGDFARLHDARRERPLQVYFIEKLPFCRRLNIPVTLNGWNIREAEGVATFDDVPP